MAAAAAGRYLFHLHGGIWPVKWPVWSGAEMLQEPTALEWESFLAGEVIRLGPDRGNRMQVFRRIRRKE